MVSRFSERYCTKMAAIEIRGEWELVAEVEDLVSLRRDALVAIRVWAGSTLMQQTFAIIPVGGIVNG